MENDAAAIETALLLKLILKDTINSLTFNVLKTRKHVYLVLYEQTLKDPLITSSYKGPIFSWIKSSSNLTWC